MEHTLTPPTASGAAIADAHLALAMEAVEMGAWQWDVRANKVLWSTSLERIHGLEPGTFDGTFEGYASDIHPDDRERVLATVQRSLAERQPHYLNYRIIRPDGEVRWLEARGRLFLGADGEPERLVGVCMDVTAKREHEDAAREAQRRRDESETALREQQRLTGLARDVSLALTREGELPEVLQRCAEVVVEHLGAAFARIWTLNEREQVLELQASAGMYTHIDGPHGRVPVGKFKIGLIARERRPHLTNDVLNDQRIGDPAWARREGMVAFAGFPLLVGDLLVGVLAMFAKTPLSDADFNGLGTVANALSVGIARARASSVIRARAEELARTAAELQYQRDLTMTIANNTASALFMMDINGYPIFINAAACEMTGYSGIDEIKGRPLHYAVHFRKPDGSPYPMEECPIDQANAEIVALRAQREIFCRKDGSLFPVEYNVAPITRDGQRLGAVIEVRDITSELAAADALRQHADNMASLAAALQRSNRDLDQFAYVASHDLKAPLRGIANLSQWIEEDLGGAVPEGTREHLKLLRGRVQRMEALIDGVLQYSRAGRTTEPPETVPVRRLVSDVVELLAPPDRIQFDIDPRLPTLETVRLPLQQVFLNLVSNAIKHAGAVGDPRIAIAGAREDAHWRFSVSDNGPGIAPAFHEKIWGIFQTLQPRDQVEGTGIGLALVKKIVESRGGSAWVESDEGRGATFHFTWPDEAPQGHA